MSNIITLQIPAPHSAETFQPDVAHTHNQQQDVRGERFPQLRIYTIMQWSYLVMKNTAYLYH